MARSEEGTEDVAVRRWQDSDSDEGWKAMSQRIFLTGARGFLGRNLLQAAAEKLPHASFLLLARSAQADEDLRGRFGWPGRDRLGIA